MSNKKYFYPADILLPKTDFEKWAVVACDQYTSQPDYWADIEKSVGDTPSSLKIVLPEAYLGNDDKAKIDSINGTMEKYINNDIFNEYTDSLIYIERASLDGTIRQGIVGLVDLDDYDYSKGSKALIRATEETVLDRIPPRVEIRKNASLELPHVMLLIDDPDMTVIQPLSGQKSEFNKVYDFALMKNGGHIEGYILSEAAKNQINSALVSLVNCSNDNFLFAVGDGNHSLATAKECYSLNKNEKSKYALVEIVNIHDKSIEFEPIYRVVFNVNTVNIINEFLNSLGGEYYGDDAQIFKCVYGNNERKVSVKPSAKLSVGTLQTFLDKYLSKNTNASIDYIHGEDVVYDLAKKEDTIGFIFEGMKKNELFPAIKANGSLPRKTFSMGHANDKRYYIESRKIK